MVTYFGGKNKMAEWIYPFIPRDIETYVEVFSGAMWVYFNPKSNFKHVDKIVYNDINKHMVNLYHSLKHYDEFLIEIDRQFEKGGDLYCSKDDVDKYKQFYKDIYYQYKNDNSPGNFLDNPTENYPDIKAAVTYSFLLSSSFNGCWMRSAGCAPFNKERLKYNALYNKLKKEEYRSKLDNLTNIESMDFEKLIKKYDSKSTYFYLDPPYEGREHWYGVDNDQFGRKGHERLANILQNTKAKWSLSYYAYDELEDWYPKDKYRWETKDFFKSSITFSDLKDKGSELLIMNYKISDKEYNDNKKYFSK